MARERVNFIATKYKNKPARVNFYTKHGTRVSFDTVQKVPTKQSVSFYVTTKGRKKK